MKKIHHLLILCLSLIILVSCGKDDPATPHTSNLDVTVYKQKATTNGGFENVRIKAGIKIWNEDRKELSINNIPEAAGGKVYDNISKKLIYRDYSAYDEGVISLKNIPAGKYLVFVQEWDSSKSQNNLGWSYTRIEVKKDETISIEKVFSHDIQPLEFEEWD